MGLDYGHLLAAVADHAAPLRLSCFCVTLLPLVIADCCGYTAGVKLGVACCYFTQLARDHCTDMCLAGVSVDQLVT